MKKIYFFLFFTLFFIASCNKESTSLTPQSTDTITATDNLDISIDSSSRNLKDEEENRYESMVKTAAVGLFELAKDPNLRTEVNQLIQKQFDGDDNTLLKALSSRLEKNGVNLLDDMENSIDLWKTDVENLSFSNSLYHDVDFFDTENEIGETIDGFRYYEDNLFIQIFIPFIDQVNLNSTPVIALGMDDEEITDGYILNSNGSISGLSIDENFAMNNLVWVISVNEVVNNNGEVDDPRDYANNISNTASSRTPGDNSLRIASVSVSTKNDFWLNGKGEVSIVMASVSRFSCDFNETRQRLSFLKVGDDDVNVTFDLDNTAVLYETFSPLPISDEVGWIFFEKDTRRKHIQTLMIPCSYPNNTQSFTIISKQAVYGIEGYFNIGPRNLFTWHEVGPYTYSGGNGVPSGSEITHELLRLE